MKKMKPKSTARKLSQVALNDLQKEVEFSPEEIREWFLEYNSRLGPNQKELTIEQFKDVYNERFSGDATEFAEHIFRTFDKDENGVVDFKEFLIGLCVSSGDDTDKKLKWAFKMYDINGDGEISRSEMRSIMTVSVLCSSFLAYP